MKLKTKIFKAIGLWLYNSLFSCLFVCTGFQASTSPFLTFHFVGHVHNPESMLFWYYLPATLIFFCCAIASLSVIYYIYAHAYVYEPCFLLMQIYLCTMLVCYIICCHYVNFVPMVYVFLFYLNPNLCYFFLNTAV